MTWIETRMIRRLAISLLLWLLPCVIRPADGYSYYDSLSVCSDASIDVTGVSILCDTPGVWYYGSNGYRGSQTCQKGDKATLTVTFDIIDELDPDDDIFFTVSVFGGDQEYDVYKSAQLCEMGHLKRTSGVACPYQGSFTVYTKFYFEDDNDDDDGNDKYLGDDDDMFSDGTSSSSFHPLVTIGFESQKNSGEYDLGGANTNLCVGQTVNIESAIQDAADSVKSSLSDPIVKFLLSFGLVIALIAVMGGFAFYIWNTGWCDKPMFTFPQFPQREPVSSYSLADDDVTFVDIDRKRKMMAQDFNIMPI